jgi:hypothetical protein
MTDTPKKTKAGLLDNKHDDKPEETCEWYINAPKHHNCLWIYIIDKSAVDGSMPELVQSEIAQLLGWSNTKTHFMLKQAMSEFIEALHRFKANQLISSSGPDHSIELPSITSFAGDVSGSGDSED